MLPTPKAPPKLPFLEALCWQTHSIKHLAPEEMLRRYERGWHYRGVLANPSPEEEDFIKEIAQFYGSWLATDIQFGKMFNRDFHEKILTVLSHLNPSFFRECRAYFGGGTLVSLRHGEYRLSKDIDFICPVGEGYRLLRQEVADRGYNSIFARLDNITLPREIQADRYGVRFPVVVDKTPIKLEIVIEDRIQLGQPDYPSWSPVPCLNEIDSFAEKLLANADRWSDASIESRDLIDLAAQRLGSPIPKEAIDKAEKAYPVLDPLRKAIRNFQQNPRYRERCFSSLGIQTPSAIVDGLDLLASDLSLEATARTFIEQAPNDFDHDS